MSPTIEIVFRKQVPSVAMRCHFAFAAVVSLLLICGPAAVTGFVIAVIVWEAVHGCSCWSSTHIRQKVLEYKPSLANHNSASTIIRIVWVEWVTASLNHLRPAYMLRTASPAMRSMYETIDLASQATARFTLATIKRLSNDFPYSSAIASCRVHPALADPSCALYNLPSAKTFPGEIRTLAEASITYRFFGRAATGIAGTSMQRSIEHKSRYAAIALTRNISIFVWRFRNSNDQPAPETSSYWNDLGLYSHSQFYQIA